MGMNLNMAPKIVRLKADIAIHLQVEVGGVCIPATVSIKSDTLEASKADKFVAALEELLKTYDDEIPF